MKKLGTIFAVGTLVLAGTAWAGQEGWTDIKTNESLALDTTVDNPCTDRVEKIHVTGEDHWVNDISYNATTGEVKLNIHSNHQGGKGLDPGPDGVVGNDDDIAYEVPGNYKLQVDTRKGVSLKVHARCPLISHGNTPNFIFAYWYEFKINDDFTVTREILKDDTTTLVKCVGNGTGESAAEVIGNQDGAND